MKKCWAFSSVRMFPWLDQRKHFPLLASLPHSIRDSHILFCHHRVHTLASNWKLLPFLSWANLKIPKISHGSMDEISTPSILHVGPLGSLNFYEPLFICFGLQIQSTLQAHLIKSTIREILSFHSIKSIVKFDSKPKLPTESPKY